MPLKFVKQESTAVFEEDGSKIVFRRPSGNEITAHNLRYGKKYAHAYVDVAVGAGKKPLSMLDFAKLSDAELAELLDSDIKFAAERMELIDNVEVVDGDVVITNASELSADQKFKFLSWLAERSDLFSDFIRKFVTPQKKT